MYAVGDRLYLNDPRNINAGQIGTVEEVRPKQSNPYLFRLDGDEYAFWFAAHHLSTSPVLAYSQERDLTYRAQGKKSTDFDKGFGIGGLSRHAEDEGLDEMIATGQLVPCTPTGNKMAHGQLWEPCPRCRTEPVCVECGYCERHCTC